LTHGFKDIVSIDNLLSAWREFVPGKAGKKDVREFYRHLADNIISLHEELENDTYRHGGYIHFRISDPKPRDIHKATIRDRLVHHAIYRVLYPFLSDTFIADSYSCQLGKGTHRAIRRFRTFAGQVSRNNTQTCWILKCDIRKFFASIDHAILMNMLSEYITDQRINTLLREVIQSFCWQPGKGLPLGNLTSQLFVNVYMNEFDQFMKHTLKVKYYLRYADDFVVMSDNRSWLKGLIPIISNFLTVKLKLTLHPSKVFIKTLASGVDFLGWVHFPYHQVLRTSSKRRMLNRITENPETSTMQSYLGLLQHGNAYKLAEQVINQTYLWK